MKVALALMILMLLVLVDAGPLLKERIPHRIGDGPVRASNDVLRRTKRAVTRRYIYFNAKVYTVDVDSDPDWHIHPKRAMVVEGEKIIYIGGNSKAKSYYRRWANDRKINLLDKVILPGLHDVHVHPIEAMSEAGAACIFRLSDSIETVGSKLKTSNCAYDQVGTDWVLGHGHSIEKVLDHMATPGLRTPREILDEAMPNKPVVLMEATSHSVLVNSRALELAGITASTPDVAGGVVWKDDNGEPNGILLENAGNAIMNIAMARNDDLDYWNYYGLLDALWLANKNGITSLCDARSYIGRGHDAVWDKLLAEEPNKFTVRAILGLWAAPEALNDPAQIAQLKSHYSNDPNSLLRKSQVKIYSDGLLQSTTAAMLSPYRINLGLQGLEANTGINYFTEERIKRYIEELQDFDNGEGFDFHVHAIGDRGIREVLNAIEAKGQSSSRHRITHVEAVAPSDVSRFKDLGVIADFQTAGDWTTKSWYTSDLAELIGQTKASFNVPIRTMVDSGAKVTLSSDFDVSGINPFLGMYHSLIRGDQSIDIKTAVEAYTINAAYVMRQESKVGSLKVGKEADFVIINQDILAVDKHKIPDTWVWGTYLKGRRVY